VGRVADVIASTDAKGQAMLNDSNCSNVDVAKYLGLDESGVRRYRNKHHLAMYSEEYLSRPDAPPVAAPFDSQERARLHARLDQILSDPGITAGKVQGLRVSQWDSVMRGSDGEPLVTQLQGIKLDLKVNEEAPAWPLVDRPAVRLTVIPAGTPRPPHGRDLTAVILPDTQIGYRMSPEGVPDPFHDEDAIDVAMQLTKDINPDLAICLGDFQDFAEFGRFTQEAGFARTTQLGIDRGYEFMVRLRQVAPGAEIKVLEGNHDVRAEKRTREVNMAAWGLRQAADTSGWPVMSVPHLCCFDEVDAEYVSGYPAGEIWLNDRLRCIHGQLVRSGSSTAAAVVKSDGASTIFGHVHRIEMQYITERTRKGGRTRLAMTPGCLCRIDGAVPSAKSATDLSGRTVPSSENWQQGMAIVEYRKGNCSFFVHPVYINTYAGYETRFGGHIYLPRHKRKEPV
jgi:predicted phosphodiesterase